VAFSLITLFREIKLDGLGMNILDSWKTENERFEGISSSPVNMATDSKYLKSVLVHDLLMKSLELLR